MNYSLDLKGNEAEIEIFDTIMHETDEFYGEIGSKDVINQIKNLGNNVDHIKVHINSDGGSIVDTLAIYNTLVDHKAEVTTVVNGLAASAASWLVQAGDHRIMYENSLWMSHRPMSFFFFDALNASELREEADILDVFQNSIAGVYSKRTGMTIDQANELMNTDTWLNADKVKELNLIDEIVENKSNTSYSEAVNKYSHPEWVDKLIKQQKPEEKEKETENDNDLALGLDFLSV